MSPNKPSSVFKPFCSPMLQKTPVKNNSTTPNSVTTKRHKLGKENVNNDTPQKPQEENRSRYHTPCRRIGLARPKKKLQRPLESERPSPLSLEKDSSEAKPLETLEEATVDGSEVVEAEPRTVSPIHSTCGSLVAVNDTKSSRNRSETINSEGSAKECKPEAIQLGRFTTEEYLAEYKKDPVSFAKSLNENNDSEDDFVPLAEVKNKCKKKKRKEYTAIYCPVSKVSKKLTVVLDRDVITATESHESDEEMFSCSPEDEKKQRQNLLDLVKKIKEEIEEKEKLLDRLQYCAVYKKKHDKEKLKGCTEKWLKGCKIGLKELLGKMQELGPIDMGQLVKKLGIPEHIVNKLNLL